MELWRIDIRGRVQGVGFRPFIQRLGKENTLIGRVRNTSSGLVIELEGDESTISSFCKKIKEEAPPLSRITSLNYTQISFSQIEGFQIEESDSQQAPSLLLAPDYGMCSSCEKEIHDPQNRRSVYPFTTCINCGPRYSIIEALPYDRATTSMRHFSICKQCQQEYEDLDDPRLHAQSLSCPDCGIGMQLWSANGDLLTENNSEIFELVVNRWKENKIVAIKGIGGYILTCDANSREAISLLRKRKHRPAKPMAIMMENIEKIEEQFHLSLKEKEALSSEIAPIVLLQPRDKHFPDELNPGLSKMGLMRAYTPLFSLLLKQFGSAIVATSGNVSNEAICYQDDDALQSLSKIADLILGNEREIIMPQDDSLIQFSPKSQQKIVLRRSRGMAPEFISAPKLIQTSVLAMGADLKASISLSHQSNMYFSQYLGKLDFIETQQRMGLVREKFLQLLGAKPSAVLADLHPGYHSRKIAQDYAKAQEIPIHFIQHHVAHFAAILGEHNIWEESQEILGVIWDGTGYGEDGQIWGGEFFLKKKDKIEHITQWKPVPVLAGDKMAQEPRIAALSFLADVEGFEEVLSPKFSGIEWKTYHQLLARTSIATSSVGRLFDAVGSMLGLCDVQAYEGHAAMLLEELATTYKRDHRLNPYPVELKNGNQIDHQLMLKGILQDIKAAIPLSEIAYKFHLTLVKTIEFVAKEKAIQTLAFSGGVFQNSLLVDLLIEHLGNHYKLYFHEVMSPNDENISFGQLMYYLHLHTSP